MGTSYAGHSKDLTNFVGTLPADTKYIFLSSLGFSFDGGADA